MGWVEGKIKEFTEDFEPALFLWLVAGTTATLAGLGIWSVWDGARALLQQGEVGGLWSVAIGAVLIYGGIIGVRIGHKTIVKKEQERDRVLRRTLQAYAKALLATKENETFFMEIYNELRQLIQEPEVRKRIEKLPGVDLEGLMKDIGPRERPYDSVDFALAVNELARFPDERQWEERRSRDD